jgi:glycerate kinase
MKKIVVAPDSFKNCMRSMEVCEIIEKAFKNVEPNCNIIKVPMADGGEGTVSSALHATNGVLKKVAVTGPLGNTVEAEYGLIPNTGIAIMEMASASGIELLNKNELNPLVTTTYGTGELIDHIIRNEKNIKEIVVGIGGSATVDGGCGMAQALGYQFLDYAGNEIKFGGGNLSRIATISDDNVDEKVKNIKIRVACDVTNPLLGEDGAAKVFAPQKGATPDMVEKLEAGLSNLFSVIKSKGIITSEQTGDGAAGGLGFGLRTFCNATIESGAKLLIEITNLKKHLSNCDLLITGEGCTDGQTSGGKLCSVIAEIGRESNVPVVLLSGALKGDLQQINLMFDGAFSISIAPESLEEAIANGKAHLYFTAQSIAEMYLSITRKTNQL